ncbi:MAG: hypothetical protein IJU16_02405 [Clostridia bacterium]|nr:hypothetical protein [Clostridia bacterium]
MFGYVRIYKPELKMREFDQYQGVYCTLCRRLGKRYGPVARMTLSYDFTFLALYLLAFREACPCFHKGRCSFNPFKKRLCCGDAKKGDPSIDYAADVAMLLVYYQLDDTVRDERLFKRLAARIGRALTRRAFRKAAAYRPAEAAAVKAYVEQQQALEAAKTSLVDAAAEPTAKLMAMLATASLPADVPHDTAARFGYCLGRFIYLADAADDLETDLQNGSYNPYVLSRELSPASQSETIRTAKEYAAESLHACVAACAESYEQLPVRRFDGILKNVLYAGLPTVIRQIKERTDDVERSV